MLASACDHGLYSTDEHSDRHARQARQSTQPVMFAYQHDDPMMYQQDQPAAEKAALWRSFYAERFPMIGAELATAGPMVAEGVDLLPDSIASVAASARAVWLLPTRSFWEPRRFLTGVCGGRIYRRRCRAWLGLLRCHDRPPPRTLHGPWPVCDRGRWQRHRRTDRHHPDNPFWPLTILG